MAAMTGLAIPPGFLTCEVVIRGHSPTHKADAPIQRTMAQRRPQALSPFSIRTAQIFAAVADDFGAVIEGQVTRDGDVRSTWTASPLPDAWRGDAYWDTDRRHVDRRDLWTIHGGRDVCLRGADYGYTAMTGEHQPGRDGPWQRSAAGGREQQPPGPPARSTMRRCRERGHTSPESVTTSRHTGRHSARTAPRSPSAHPRERRLRGDRSTP